MQVQAGALSRGRGICPEGGIIRRYDGEEDF